jgi:hypothetical protein
MGLIEGLAGLAPSILAAYTAFTVFNKVAGILGGVTQALLNMKLAQAATTVAQWHLNAAAAAFPVAAIAAGAAALWALSDWAAKRYNQIETAVPGVRGYNNMNPRRQQAAWAEYNATSGRSAAWRPTDTDPQEFERNSRGAFVLNEKSLEARAAQMVRDDQAKRRDARSTLEKSQSMKMRTQSRSFLNTEELTYDEALRRLREEAASDSVDGSDGLPPELKQYLKKFEELMERLNTGVDDLNKAPQRIPGTLQYSQMGVEDFWSLARAGL